MAIDKIESLERDYNREIARIANFMSYDLKKNRNFILRLLSYETDFFYYVKTLYGDDQEVILEAVKGDSGILKGISYELRDDVEFMKKAVKNNINAIRYASSRLRDDKEFILELIKDNKYFLDTIIEFAGEKLKRDEEFLMEVSKYRKKSIEHQVVSEARKYGYEDLPKMMSEYLERKDEDNKPKEDFDEER